MKKIITILFMSAMLLSSCSFLDEKSQDEVIPKSAEDYSELLLGSGYPLGYTRFYPYLYLLDDDVQLNVDIKSIASNTTVQAAFAAYTWQPNMASISNTVVGLQSDNNSYSSFYDRIKGCNAVISSVDGSEGTPELKDKTLAEALALRAWYYFNLVNLYGQPYNVDKSSEGVVLKTSVDVNNKAQKRSTVEEVYNQVVDDLKRAIDLFTPYSINTKDDRINLPTAYTILSRVYLYMEKWSDCIDAATNAIKYGPSLANISNATSWQAVCSYSFEETMWLYGCAEYSDYISSALRFVPSPALLSLYDKVNDGRYKVFFYNTGSWIQESNGKYNYYSSLIVNKDNYTSISLGNGMRIAEAWLNRAEAYMKSNNVAGATSDINAIRSKRIAGYTNVASVSLEDVLTERRKELCYECNRWFDLRRNGMPSISHVWRDMDGNVQTYTLAKSDALYTLPIPSSVLDNNSALTQNASASQPTRNNTK